jgi:Tfp pilus assembly protein PilV
VEKERSMTNLLLAIIALGLAALYAASCNHFDRAVERIEKAINRYATPNSDGSPR